MISRKRHSPEKQISMIQKADVDLSHEMAIERVGSQLSIFEQTAYTWRRQACGLKVNQAKRMNPNTPCGL